MGKELTDDYAQLIKNLVISIEYNNFIKHWQNNSNETNIPRQIISNSYKHGTHISNTFIKCV